MPKGSGLNPWGLNSVVAGLIQGPALQREVNRRIAEQGERRVLRKETPEFSSRRLWGPCRKEWRWGRSESVPLSSTEATCLFGIRGLNFSNGRES